MSSSAPRRTPAGGGGRKSLASCPLFIAWLNTKVSDSSPPLVSALHNLLKVLNNESGLSGDACAGEVLSALRGHDWIISSEEQDTHELFHVLTATIDDELISATTVPSLLDISWVDVNCMNSLEDGVVVKANSWGQIGEDGVTKKMCVERRELQMKGSTNAVKRCDSFSCKINGILVVDKCDEANVTANGTKAANVSNQSCDNKGCEDNFKVGMHGDVSTHICDGSLQHSLAIRNKNHNILKDESNMEVSLDTKLDCDSNKNCKGHKSDVAITENIYVNSEEAQRHKTHRQGKESHTGSAATRARDSNTYWKIHSDQHDSPFRGYLASQLQCTLCGHKNPAQWTSFESLSLSLPSLPWGEVTLQELLDSYITQEQVTEVTCESCTKKSGSPVKTTFTKQLTIGKLPDCLCFHIKRTVWLENGSAIKRRDHLIFPEFLIMDPYTYTTSITSQNFKVSGLEGNSDPSSINSQENSCHLPVSSIISQSATFTRIEPSPFVHVRRVRYEQLYRLKAVIVHVGDVFCGHFVTYRRGPIGSRTRNRWFYTSDLLVREASLEEVRKANAYMILYEKVT
ncbi:ubiquitin carboxyl-terminal hydrolase 30 homolog isoform X2 [Procambarus clarkii]|uniref:ubiquitin carboxyl-terminal hydrolase 30 homolog isoform X2 n=1 Tax=Procambarus clarkii TaxID=6728 RepID=UPI001E675B8D|nr:ubiquitin carboxyl-terminal hydrolase 30-like isoform X2 [Procambarus clarkii]